MTTMYEKFQDVGRYPHLDDALFEPTVRLPYALHSPAIVTHIPLFNMSQEDTNFEKQAEYLDKFFDPAGSALLAPQPSQGQILKVRGLFVLPAPWSGSNKVDKVITAAWEAAYESFKNIVASHPEYIIFRSTSLISRDINRDSHTSIVKLINDARVDSSLDAPGLWRSDLVLHRVYELVNYTLQIFLEQVIEFTLAFHQAHPPSESSSGTNEQDLLGGIVSWMGPLEFNPSNRRTESRRVFNLGQEKEAAETGGLKTIIDEYLVWRRGEQNWRYTFYDGLYEYPEKPAAQRLEGFLYRWLSSAQLERSFPPAGLLADLLKDPAASHYRLPGTRIGGAQYYVIPAELVLLLLLRFDDVQRVAGASLPYSADLRTANRHRADQCIRSLFQVGKEVLRPATLKLQKHIVEQPVTTATDLLALLRPTAKWLANVMSRLQPGSVPYREFYSSFAGMTELCWKLVYFEEQQPYGHDDFICSRVIDGRALYFSNFRPIDHADPGRECNFTRTFFIDFGLTNYQRARLARRLCEVATYRMSCIKDISRIRAMQDGLDTLNSEFSTLVATTAKEYTTAKESVANLSDAMRLANGLYQKMLDFDRFISEGVLGRRLSSEAEWARVRKQVSDLREDRVAGYAALTDFLERGLAATVADIVRFAGRYENLRNRVRDHLSRMRTQISVSHSTQIVDLLEANQALAQDSGNLLRSVRDEMAETKNLSTNSMELLKMVRVEGEKQTSFLRNADLLVLVGGVYYVKSLLDKMLISYGHDAEGTGWSGVFDELAVIAISVIGVLVLKSYAVVIVSGTIKCVRRAKWWIRKNLKTRKAGQE